MSNEEETGSSLRKSDQRSPNDAPRAAYQLADFDIVQSLGEGSFSEVIQVNLRSTGESFALKIVDKRLALRHKKVQSLKLERALLDRLCHPGIVKLHFTFQDQNSLYFSLELCPQGELFEQIHRQQQLPLTAATFYAAEILEILIYLKSQKVVHGDLKPENLLLTANGHLKLIDFGSAVDLSSFADGHRKQDDALQGTADYTPPEMLVGKPPFRAGSEYLTFEKILALDYSLPDSFSDSAKDIIKSIFVHDPSARLGASNLTALQQHPFFEGIDWSSLRSSHTPHTVDKPMTHAEDEGFDWQLSSLALSQPLRYEYDGDPDVRSVPQ